MNTISSGQDALHWLAGLAPDRPLPMHGEVAARVWDAHSRLHTAQPPEAALRELLKGRDLYDAAADICTNFSIWPNSHIRFSFH